MGNAKIRFRNGEMFVNDRRVMATIFPSQNWSWFSPTGFQLRKKLWRVGDPLPDVFLNLLIVRQQNPAVAEYLRQFESPTDFSYLCFWGTCYRGFRTEEGCHRTIEVRLAARTPGTGRRWGTIDWSVDDKFGKDYRSLVLEPIA